MLKKLIDLFSKTKVTSATNIRTQPVLGRWSILGNESNNKKIDMANIDHCGTCHYHTIKEVSKPAKLPSAPPSSAPPPS